MKQIRPPKPPAWRDPRRIREEARNQRLRPILLLLSLLIGLFLVLPPGGAFDEAISFQLARGAPTAWLLFLLMGVTLGYVAVRLWHWNSRIWSIASCVTILGLVVIATTDPRSDAHNGMFVTMSGFMLLGQIGFFYGHLDYRLLPSALLALIAVFICFDHLGIGERLLILASLISLNVLVYGHIDV